MSRVEVNSIVVANEIAPTPTLRSSPRIRRKAHPTDEDSAKCSRSKQRRTSPPQSMSHRPRRRKSASIATATNGTESSSLPKSKPVPSKRKHKRSKTSSTFSVFAGAVGDEVIEKIRLTKLDLEGRHCSAPPLVGDDKLRENSLLGDMEAPMESDSNHLGASIGPEMPSSKAKARRSWLFNLRRTRRLQEGASDKPSKSRRRSVSKSPSGNPCPNTTADFSLPSSASTSPGTPFSPATALGSMFISTPDAVPQRSSLSGSSDSSSKTSLSSFSLGEAHDSSASNFTREETSDSSAMVVSINPRPKSAASVVNTHATMSGISFSQGEPTSDVQKPESNDSCDQTRKQQCDEPIQEAPVARGEDTADFSFTSLSKPRGRRVRSVASLDEMVREALEGQELGDELVGRTSSFVAGSRVHHQWFGEGVIVSNDSKMLVCKFDKAPAESKKLNARYAVPNMVLLST